MHMYYYLWGNYEFHCSKKKNPIYIYKNLDYLASYILFCEFIFKDVNLYLHFQRHTSCTVYLSSIL